MILFIASMIIAASVAGVFTSSVDDLASAIDDQGVQVSDDVRTSIEIISDGSAAGSVYNDTAGEVTLLVKNVGTNRLSAEPSQIDILVNGQFTTSSDISVELLGDGDRWAPNDVVRITVANQNLGPDDHRAKVIVNGDEEVFRFRVE
jgi:flagellar protein FlaG